jgi:hypothetical protein
MHATKIAGIGLLMAVVTVVSTAAQQFPAPAGWKWITDQPVEISTKLDLAKGTWLFGTMAPGWHITIQPGALLHGATRGGTGRGVAMRLHCPA